MLRCLITLVSFAIVPGLILQAAVLPDHFAQYTRTSASPVSPEDRAVWDEYGFETAETATYEAGQDRLSLTAFRFHDPTGAFAAFQWQRPANARSTMTSATAPDGKLLVYANYLLRFQGSRPEAAEVEVLGKTLPNVVTSSLPPLYSYLPKKGRIPNSERYLLGSQSLSRFESRIGASLAALDRGAEGALAKYRFGQREMQLTIFGYPTPQMAIERFRYFERIPNVAAKRSGTLIAVVPEAKDLPSAVGLLDQVNYAPAFTWSEYVPKATTQDAARMILAISVLAAGLIVASLILGLFFGGGKILARRLGMRTADEDFTVLNLSGR